MRRNTGEALGSPSGVLLAYPVGVAAEDERNYLVFLREGKEVYYKAADTAQARLLHHVIEELVEITCPDCAEEHR